MVSPSFSGNHLRVRYTFMAVSTLLILFNFLFVLCGSHDLWLMCFFGAGVLAVLIYLVPAAILCWRNRESGWERGWVEFFFLTFQILMSWVDLSFLGLQYHPRICTSGSSGGYLPFYFPWGKGPWDDDHDPSYICKLVAVSIAFTCVYSLVLLIWFGWTLWLTTKVAKTMGEPWTRDLVLKKVSMGKMSKLHQWRDGEEFGMGKVNSAS